MHAAHIGSMEAISDAPPLKVSGAAHPLLQAESFGLSWQREMNSRAANALATSANAANANVTDAMRRSMAGREVASGAVPRDKESSALTVESKSAGDTEQEPLSKVKESDVLKLVPKTAADSEAGVEAGPEVKREGSLPVAPDGLSVPSKAASPGMKWELSSMIGTKEKNAVARSIHGTNEGPAPTLGNEATVFATPELMAQMGVGQTVAMPIATASGGHADSQDVQAEDAAGKSCSTEKIASPGIKRDWPSVAGKVATARREATAGKETGATSLEPEAKPGKVHMVAASGASDSVRGATLDGLQQASTVLQPVSTGTAGVAVQPMNSIHASAPSAAAALRSDAAGSAEGAVSAGHPVMAAGPGRLDVGVFDGTHGWLRIHAELGAGGAVNASLTASASAHEALRAAVPEMARYLESEAVTVSKIAVHRIAENSSSMSLPPGGSQQDGDTQGRHETRDGAGATQRNSTLENGDGSGPASARVSSATDESAAGVSGFSGWIGGLSGVMPWIATAGGYWEGGSGSWLNVSA